MHRLDQISAKKPAKLPNSKSLTQTSRAGRFGRFFYPNRGSEAKGPRSRVVGSFTLIRSPPRNCCDIRQTLVGDSGRPTVGGRLARKLTQQEASKMAARRKLLGLLQPRFPKKAAFRMRNKPFRYVWVGLRVSHYR